MKEICNEEVRYNDRITIDGTWENNLILLC